MEKILICSNCDNPIGNCNYTDIGILCNDCFKDYKLENHWGINEYTELHPSN